MATHRNWEPRWTRKVNLHAGLRLVGIVAVVMEVSFRTSGVGMASSLKPKTGTDQRQLFLSGTTEDREEDTEKKDHLNAHGKSPPRKSHLRSGQVRPAPEPVPNIGGGKRPLREYAQERALSAQVRRDFLSRNVAKTVARRVGQAF
jgi:hypothetical protein